MLNRAYRGGIYLYSGIVYNPVKEVTVTMGYGAVILRHNWVSEPSIKLTIRW